MISNRMFVIGKKEFYHIINDPRTLAIVFLMPVLQLIILGYAMRTELQELSIGIIDYDNSTISRELIAHFKNNDFFKLIESEIEEINDLFLNRKAKAVLIIERGFSENLHRMESVPVQLIIDASDQNTANFALNYTEKVVRNFSSQFAGVENPLEIRIRNWYNPQGKSTYFIVPGILAIILVMICAMLTSIAVTREKETGTLEQLLISAVTPTEIILGKVIPYIFLAVIDAALVLSVSFFLFRVPFYGSLFLLTLLSLLYIICSLSLGLLISTVSNSQQNAMMFAIAATLLPSMFLSGFFFSIRSMPVILQRISQIVPARYYLQIVRGIMLKSNTLAELLPSVFPLIIMSILLLTLSVKRFKNML
ncbi:MAG: ABC transporter permease [Candidatus Cloacimonetes bacterium]|nr:ABC transporter permease [Candidatus Cloacimonadota bacterium]